VPAYYMHLDNMPLTESGKLNRNALPEFELKKEAGYEGAATAIQQQLVQIWAGVLKLDSELISINHSFFELGGHSLKATVLINRIFREMNIEIPLQEVFKLNTIAELSAYIENENWLLQGADSELSAGDEFIFD